MSKGCIRYPRTINDLLLCVIATEVTKSTRLVVVPKHLQPELFSREQTLKDQFGISVIKDEPRLYNAFSDDVDLSWSESSLKMDELEKYFNQ